MSHPLQAMGSFIFCGIAGFVVLAGAEALLGEDTVPSTKDSFTPAERSHWSFQPVQRRPVPEIAAASAVCNAVDRFILDKLEKSSLSLSPEASRFDLIRRLKFDLLGLPPTMDEANDFASDDRPDAYERLVERFLASPQFGECQSRMWLDVVRYAETAGYNADPLRPLAYQYRDWAIRSFNEDKPVHRFLREQLAGDELFPSDAESQIATGYLRMWPDESNASNILLARQDMLNDLTGNVAATFLGLTLACSQCHDHKFDPLPQRDFYALQAFFAGVVPTDEVPVGEARGVAAFKSQHQEWLDATEPLRKEIAEIEASARIPLTAEKRMKFPAVVLEALDTPVERRSAMQRQLAFWSERQVDYKDADVLKKLPEEKRKRLEALRRELAERKKSMPKPPGKQPALSIAELSNDMPKTFLLSSGTYDRPEEEVRPGYLSVLHLPGQSSDATVTPVPTGSSGRRAALARWMTDPKNPLTDRVMANRIWQQLFGKGLIENANDFGTQTAPPTHPELLDWLASELRRETGSTGPSGLEQDSAGLKHLYRTIVMSATYRQSTLRRSKANSTEDSNEVRGLAADPDNQWYWHFPRRRLSAERIRDALLSVSGELTSEMYGSGVRPPLPAGFNGREAWKVSEKRSEQNRRSVYIHAKRNLPYPMLQAFDLPDMHESCARRSQTTTAPQALLMLNSEVARNSAEAVAERILRETSSTEPAALAEAAWQSVLGRTADAEETQVAVRFFQRQLQLAEQEWSGAVRFPEGEAGIATAEVGDEPRHVALADLCHVLLNSNEFLTLE